MVCLEEFLKALLDEFSKKFFEEVEETSWEFREEFPRAIHEALLEETLKKKKLREIFYIYSIAWKNPLWNPEGIPDFFWANIERTTRGIRRGSMWFKKKTSGWVTEETNIIIPVKNPENFYGSF